jgi:hypothetical protein
MYEIYKLSEDLYQIHSSFSNEQAMEGTRIAILTYATHILGFKPDELETGLLDMLKLNRDSAHFGINRMFIYSFNKSEKYRRTG